MVAPKHPEVDDATLKLVDAARMFYKYSSGGSGSILTHRRLMTQMKNDLPEMFNSLKKLLTAVEDLDTAVFYAKHPDRQPVGSK